MKPLPDVPSPQAVEAAARVLAGQGDNWPRFAAEYPRYAATALERARDIVVAYLHAERDP